MLHPPPSPVFWFSFKFHSPVACKADSAVACSAFSVCVPKKWEIQHGYDFIIMLYEMLVYTDNQSWFFCLSTHSRVLHVLQVRHFHLWEFLNSNCLGSLFTAHVNKRKENKIEVLFFFFLAAI